MTNDGNEQPPSAACPINQHKNSDTFSWFNNKRLNSKVEETYLSDNREVSSIPSKHGPWLYPSERQFFNTTLNKGADVSPTHMNVVVAVHNSINENVWKRILQFENIHKSHCPNPKLVRFGGIKAGQTPRARIKSLMGYVEPFDTHEWFVDRCGTRIRYLIDYYDGQSNPLSGKPIAVHLDVRPELSYKNLFDSTKRLCNSLMSSFLNFISLSDLLSTRMSSRSSTASTSQINPPLQ